MNRTKQNIPTKYNKRLMREKKTMPPYLLTYNVIIIARQGGKYYDYGYESIGYSILVFEHLLI